MDTRATAKLLEHGIRFSHIARSVRVGDFDDFDLILAMDEDNYESLLSIVTDEQKSKVKMFRDFDPEGGGNVPDPYHGKVDGFEIVYNICYRTCKSLISIIF